MPRPHNKHRSNFIIIYLPITSLGVAQNPFSIYSNKLQVQILRGPKQTYILLFLSAEFKDQPTSNNKILIPRL